MDVSHMLDQVQCPTLIIHGENDQVVPIEEGRLMARRIPNAELLVLETENHILQPEEPAWARFCDAVLSFVGVPEPETDLGLTPREAEILTALCDAKSNKQIARDLGVSDKTVRNQLTRIFAKLGVATRQEAILKMQRT